jgi:hypothetical protein
MMSDQMSIYCFIAIIFFIIMIFIKFSHQMIRLETKSYKSQITNILFEGKLIQEKLLKKEFELENEIKNQNIKKQVKKISKWEFIQK